MAKNRRAGTIHLVAESWNTRKSSPPNTGTTERDKANNETAELTEER